MQKITEQSSKYNDLEKMSIRQLLVNINQEDALVPLAIARVIPDIEPLVEAVVKRLKNGGRLFYIGAGTSGRLGVVDASEIPPTFGAPDEMVIGIIAGGDAAIRTAQEFAEDSEHQAWKDLSAFFIDEKDIVIGIAASGTTPYVIGGLRKCQEMGIATGCLTNNPGAPVTKVADFPVVIEVGPEFVTGSTRMKSGTSQKLVLNMITTSTMIQLGRVVGNKMVDMQLSNNKLVDRGTKMVMHETHLDYESAEKLLLKEGSVRQAIEAFFQNSTD
ncbi:MAG TPA: N-acetylmuramic acid 6-phosphate etherase [Saprospiraceae bacterium]|nr:N-acetylmuramic acid 6-phosphate etherase [Saprospiraceae bacterium]